MAAQPDDPFMPNPFDPHGLYDADQNGSKISAQGSDTGDLGAVRTVHGAIADGFARRWNETGRSGSGDWPLGFSNALGSTSTMLNGSNAAAEAALNMSGKAGAAFIPRAPGLLKGSAAALDFGSQGLRVWSDAQKGTPWDDAMAAGIGRLGATALGGIEGGLIAGASGPEMAPIGVFIGGAAAQQHADAAGDLTRRTWGQIKHDWFPSTSRN